MKRKRNFQISVLVFAIVLTIVSARAQTTNQTVDLDNQDVELAEAGKFTEAVKMHPQNAETQFILGQIYLLNGDRPSARIQCEKVASLDSQLAKQLYAAIYGNLLVVAKKQTNKNKETKS